MMPTTWMINIVVLFILLGPQLVWLWSEFFYTHGD